VNGDKPTLIFKNGLVYSVDRAKTQSQAIAIGRDKILGVGKDIDIEAHARPGTKIVDLRGKMVLPGFVEAHAHPSLTMDLVGNISLYLMDSPEEYLREIQAHIRAAPD
jgi:predicted amidohydrolase YtcJ